MIHLGYFTVAASQPLRSRVATRFCYGDGLVLTHSDTHLNDREGGWSFAHIVRVRASEPSWDCKESACDGAALRLQSGASVRMTKTALLSAHKEHWLTQESSSSCHIIKFLFLDISLKMYSNEQEIFWSSVYLLCYPVPYNDWEIDIPSEWSAIKGEKKVINSVLNSVGFSSWNSFAYYLDFS